MRSTRAEVARRAGVSPAVVSYVLNGGPRNVAPETRRRVEEAIASLEYRPNAIAQALRGGRSGAIGVVVSADEEQSFHALFLALQRAAVAHGFAIYLGYAGDEASEHGYARSLTDRQVDALIVVSPRNIPHLVSLRQDGVPVAIVVHEQVEADLAILEVDSRRAMASLLERLTAAHPTALLRSSLLDGLLPASEIRSALPGTPVEELNFGSPAGGRTLLHTLRDRDAVAVLCATGEEVSRLRWLCESTSVDSAAHVFVSAGMDFDGADAGAHLSVEWRLDDAFFQLLAELEKMGDEPTHAPPKIEPEWMISPSSDVAVGAVRVWQLGQL